MYDDGHKLLRTFGNMSLDDFTVSNDINHVIGKLVLPEHISPSILLQRVLYGQKVLLLVFVVEGFCGFSFGFIGACLLYGAKVECEFVSF